MKVFLLAVTILLLINRIKSTPRMLSKTLYENSAQQSIDKVRKQIDNIKTTLDKETVLITVQYTTIAIAWLYSTFIVFYYMLIGNRLQTNTVMLILTSLQIVTMLIGTRMAIKDFDFVNYENMSNKKFHRSWFLFNVVLDYIYYPMTIYLLLN